MCQSDENHLLIHSESERGRFATATLALVFAHLAVRLDHQRRPNFRQQQSRGSNSQRAPTTYAEALRPFADVDPSAGRLGSGIPSTPELATLDT